MTKNEENWQNPNRLVKFFEIWYLDAFQQKEMLQKNYFSITAFFGIFLAKKQSKLIKNEENRPNLNRLIIFFEIWYVDAFQPKNIQQGNNFLILAFLGFFVGQITAKIVKKN